MGYESAVTFDYTDLENMHDSSYLIVPRLIGSFIKCAKGLSSKFMF